jgi:hypothetical protein
MYTRHQISTLILTATHLAALALLWWTCSYGDLRGWLDTVNP